MSNALFQTIVPLRQTAAPVTPAPAIGITTPPPAPRSPRTAPAPGIHYDLSFGDYCQMDAVNASRLKFFKRSPLHARHDLLHDQEETASLLLGHATHTMVLEPQNFAKNYAIFPDAEVIAKVMKANPETKSPRSTSIYKTDKAAWEAQHMGHCQIDGAEYDRAKAIQKAVMANPVAAQLFGGDGESELTLVWKLENGDTAKGRIDRLCRYNGQNCIVDLKTWAPKDKDAVLNAHSVSRQIAKFGYHNSAAWYEDGLQALAPAKYITLLVFVESEAPYDVVVYELDAAAIEKGRIENAGYLAQWNEAKKTGRWPGVAGSEHAIQSVGLPAYYV